MYVNMSDIVDTYKHLVTMGNRRCGRCEDDVKTLLNTCNASIIDEARVRCREKT